MEQRSKITPQEAVELIKQKGRLATVVVHDDGTVVATAIGDEQSRDQRQKEVDACLSDLQREYRIVRHTRK